MENSYLCPFCRGQLKIENHIVFAAKIESGKRGLIFLSPQLGDYRCLHSNSFQFKTGERMEILCPICHANLTALNVNKNLAEVIMVDRDGVEYIIYFSEIFGEKCTYKIHEKDLESFGDDSAQYINFFGV